MEREQGELARKPQVTSEMQIPSREMKKKVSVCSLRDLARG